MPLVRPLPADHSPAVAQVISSSTRHSGFRRYCDDSMATSLEGDAERVGSTHLAARGWSAGKHR
jgi:hypothetical protein